jgi:hypothetical protein
MSFLVAVSIPSRPGEELTSKTKGPRADCSKSTPQIPKPRDLAAFKAAFSSSSVSSMIFALPPLCKLERQPLCHQR